MACFYARRHYAQVQDSCSCLATRFSSCTHSTGRLPPCAKAVSRESDRRSMSSTRVEAKLTSAIRAIHTHGLCGVVFPIHCREYFLGSWTLPPRWAWQDSSCRAAIATPMEEDHQARPQKREGAQQSRGGPPPARPCVRGRGGHEGRRCGRPTGCRGHLNLGNILSRLGQRDEAVRQ